MAGKSLIIRSYTMYLYGVFIRCIYTVLANTSCTYSFACTHGPPVQARGPQLLVALYEIELQPIAAGAGHEQLRVQQSQLCWLLHKCVCVCFCVHMCVCVSQLLQELVTSSCVCSRASCAGYCTNACVCVFVCICVCVSQLLQELVTSSCVCSRASCAGYCTNACVCVRMCVFLCVHMCVCQPVAARAEHKQLRVCMYVYVCACAQRSHLPL